MELTDLSQAEDQLGWAVLIFSFCLGVFVAVVVMSALCDITLAKRPVEMTPAAIGLAAPTCGAQPLTRD